MDRKKMEMVSEKLMLRVNETVLKDLEKDYKVIEKKIVAMQSINTDKVEPLSRVHGETTTFLREDVHTRPHMDNFVAMKNAPEKEAGYFVVSKVVADEK